MGQKREMDSYRLYALAFKEYLKVYILQSHIQNVGPCDCVIHGVALLAGQGADSIF